MTYTQELRRFGADVTWQWNSPKRHHADEPVLKVKEKTQKLRKGIYNVNQQDSPSPSRAHPSMPMQLSGFHKFKKELLKLNLLTDGVPQDEDGVPKDDIVMAEAGLGDGEHRRSSGSKYVMEVIDNPQFL
jgi:hypothetical protein